MQLLVGIDVGSSSCKVTAINPQGIVIGSGTHAYPTRYPRPGWAEQDPEDWYQVACQAIRTCSASGDLDPRDVAGLAIVGPAHNVALMDDAGEVVHPTIHWSDLRSTPQSQRIEAQFGDRVFQITFQRVNPSWTLAQLLWLKENRPDVWSQVRRILVTKDYVRYRFTGVYQTEPYDAIGTQMYDVGADRWSTELCDLVGFRSAWLPPVAPTSAVAGGLLPAAAQDTGLRAGTPVVVGSADTVVEALGVGVVEPGQGIVKLGTAACVNLVTAGPLPSPETLTYRHVIDGRWFSITATNSGASAMRWFRDTFCRQEVAQAKAQGVSVYELIGDLAEGAPVGCEGLLFHPYLMGERSPYWDPRLRADFVGIGAHHRIHHFARAILEGVAFSIRDCYCALAELGHPVTELRLTGGGGRSPLWRRIVCDVLGRPLIKPSGDASSGAAMLAGVGVALFRDWQDAVDTCTRIEKVLHPDRDAHAVYSEHFEIYRGVTRDLAVHSHHLVDLVSGGTTSHVSS